ncbi:MAG: cytochrome c3 family protein [Deltaproteobacteria bacterium]|jgi:cytochrome c553|nr:cytochrome c3 family protein [Deltaproteobacteria bacterium]
MKKCVPSILALLLLAFVPPASSAQPDAPADGIKMARTRQAVIFNHSTHQKGMKCGDCHHPVNGKEDYGKCAGPGCHDSMDRKDKSAKGYYHAMHAKSGAKFATCASCHAREAEKYPDKKKELTACRQSKCHS